MNQALHLASTDRILYFAPHPDDESLAGGGLIQKAMTLGAQVRVIFVTSGDRNPWPQRVLERKLFVDAKARTRWGALRRAEALRALEVLGMGQPAEVHFLNWPDQGVTPLLMGADEAAMDTICRMMAEWRPTIVFSPAGEDTHPDHSAFFVMVQIALDRLRRSGFEVRQALSYLVHVPHAHLAREVRFLKLSPAEKALKADAIQAHETQMLTRKRFLSHAREIEEFHLPFAPEGRHSHHPVVDGEQSCGALRLRIKLPRPLLSFRGAVLHVALETLLEGSLRWSLQLPGRSAKARVIDARTGKPHRWATVRIQRRAAVVSIPIVPAQPVERLFIKFDRRPFFFDIAGWREIPVDETRKPRVRFHPFTASKRSASAE
jgi:LmbE family N-acetylglucosaminyl deacetylase